MLFDTIPGSTAPATPDAPRTMADRPGGEIEIVLDLSRLLSRSLHATPTGIDRVEMAYARTLRQLIPHRLQFGAVHPAGLYGRLPLHAVDAFLDCTQTRWEAIGGGERPAETRAHAIRHCWSLRPRAIARPTRPRVLLQVSPHHLHRPRIVAGKLRREQARFVCMVHDLIPISHPEYARPNGADRHRRRLRTIDAFADGILANSSATLEALVAHWDGGMRQRPMRAAPLGTEAPADPPRTATAPEAPYFLCVATIEPRKNHLLLLHVWRSMIELLGAAQTPRLLLVGRRGWENENIVDLLDRCPSLRSVVQELPRLPDADLRVLLRDARAVLLPSFAEGFDLPLAEALSAGVPVLASDIAAHREAGGAVPDYIDAIDGIGWRSAVLDYCAPASVRRAAQLERLARRRPVRWETHVRAALAMAEEVTA